MPARRLPAPSLPAWIEAMLPEDTRRYRVEVEGLTLHVCERGPEDAPPVLLLHGNPTWSFLYRKVAGALRGSPLRLVIPDLPGLGLSEKPRDPAFHTLRNHARVLGGLIDALALERVIFVGQDWGGPIGLRALAERPGRLAGLVVLHPGLGPHHRPGLHRGALPEEAGQPAPHHRRVAALGGRVPLQLHRVGGRGARLARRAGLDLGLDLGHGREREHPRQPRTQRDRHATRD